MTTLSRIVLLSSFIAVSAFRLSAAGNDVVNRAEPVVIKASGGVSGASEPGLLFLLGSGFIAAGMLRRFQRMQ